MRCVNWNQDKSASRPTSNKGADACVKRIKKVQAELSRRFGGAVTAQLAEGVLTLTGSLPAWQQVVEAGRLCADPKAWSVVNLSLIHI